MSETVGSIQVVATINTKDYEAGKKTIEKGNNELENGANKTSKSFSATWIGAIAGVAAALTTKFLGAITNAVGTAVKRFDTLNNFPRVLQAMGISSDEASSSIKKIADSLKGLPTSLQDGASGVQQFVAAGLGVGKATDLYLAMNNALIAGGANAADVGVTMDGKVKAISSGPAPASTLTAMLSRMPTATASLLQSTG